MHAARARVPESLTGQPSLDATPQLYGMAGTSPGPPPRGPPGLRGGSSDSSTSEDRLSSGADEATAQAPPDDHQQDQAEDNDNSYNDGYGTILIDSSSARVWSAKQALECAFARLEAPPNDDHGSGDPRTNNVAARDALPQRSSPSITDKMPKNATPSRLAERSTSSASDDRTFRAFLNFESSRDDDSNDVDHHQRISSSNAEESGAAAQEEERGNHTSRPPHPLPLLVNKLCKLGRSDYAEWRERGAINRADLVGLLSEYQHTFETPLRLAACSLAAGTFLATSTVRPPAVAGGGAVTTVEDCGTASSPLRGGVALYDAVFTAIAGGEGGGEKETGALRDVVSER